MFSKVEAFPWQFQLQVSFHSPDNNVAGMSAYEFVVHDGVNFKVAGQTHKAKILKANNTKFKKQD